MGAAAVVAAAGALPAAPAEPDWAEPMRAVHARFTGAPGTFAQFGDSITVTLAYWTPLLYVRKNAPPELEAAFARVKAYLRPECWRDWKGPEFGNEGSRTMAWAREHVQAWLRKLNPEVALIMFGTNDLDRIDADRYADQTRAVARACLDNGTVVILSTIPPRSGAAAKAAAFAEVVRGIAREMRVPLIDFHGEILARRPEDWDGASERFAPWQGYDVPTLIARDGVHPSNPPAFRDDYSEEGLRASGYGLRSALTLLAYDEVVRMLRAAAAPAPRGWPAWFPRPAALPPPAGEIVEVKDAAALLAAAKSARPGATILVAKGRYAPPARLELAADGITLRGATGNPDDVVLDGGPAGLGELVAVRRAVDVCIADLTVENVRWNGIKIDSETGVHGLAIRNCVIRNVWQRGVKGVKVLPERRAELGPSRCLVEGCFFRNDRAKTLADDPADAANGFNGNYVGGIDVMDARGWIIRGNVFTGIKGRTGEARGAVFLWHDSEDCVIERNAVLDCDAGICLGNSHKPPETRVHAARCTVRNNFIARAPENGILADYTEDCRILHNTVSDPESRLGRLIRIVHAADGLIVANNLLDGPPPRKESASAVDLRGNLAGEHGAWFVDAARGDLHLAPGVERARVGVPALPGVTGDIDGDARGARPAAGADEP